MPTVDTDSMLAQSVENYFSCEIHELICDNDDCGETFDYSDDQTYTEEDKNIIYTVVDCPCCGHQNQL